MSPSSADLLAEKNRKIEEMENMNRELKKMLEDRSEEIHELV
jgi:hypothetical protein